jgi:hypothetical protein
MDPYKMKKFAAVLAITCGMPLLSSTAAAIEEVIVTGYPQPAPTFDVPSTGSSAYTGYVSGAYLGGYKDAAIAAAKKQCMTEFAAKQKKACDDKKELIFKTQIENCNNLGDAGTAGMAVGGVGVAVGTGISLLGGPAGWAVLFIVGGGTVAAQGAVTQQEGNYGCSYDANQAYQYNTQACINYEKKLQSDFCSKIY